MKKYLKQILQDLLFLVILCTILLGLSKVVIPKDNAPEDGMPYASANGFLSEPADTVDVVALGDSVCYASFISLRLWEKHGFTVYNCGSSEQKLDYSAELLEKMFLNHSPGIVILESSAIFRSISLDEVLMDQAEKVLPVFSFHDRWKSLKPSDLEFKVTYTYKDYAKGYQFEDDVKPADTDSYIWETTDTVYIPVQNRSYIRQMKSLCDEHGARLILVSAPSTVNWNIMRHNSLEKLAKKLGIEYLDMNLMQEKVPIDWGKDTFDKGDHLNYFGAEKVTAFLGDYLEETGLLTDHRGDTAYKQWDEDTETFNRIIKELLAEGTAPV